MRYEPAKPLSPALAEALFSIAKASGLGTTELAKRAGVQSNHMLNILKGRKRPSRVVASRLIEVLGLNEEIGNALLAESSDRGRYSRHPEWYRPQDEGESLTTDEPTRTWRTLTINEQTALLELIAIVAPETADRHIFCYLARLPNGLIKIGKSYNPFNRVKQFYGELICVLPSGDVLESWLHKEFDEYRVTEDMGREVFRPEGRLVEYIVEHAGKGLTPPG